MPPFVPSKRRAPSPPRTSARKAARTHLFETTDSEATKATLEDNEAFINSLNVSDDDSGLSDVSSAQFEDALSPHKQQNGTPNQAEEEDDEVDWEDAIEEKGQSASSHTEVPSGPLGNLEITLDQASKLSSLSNPFDKKKGPSKIERQIRTSTHCMHVQLLLFHNLLRNGWTCNEKIQRILVDRLPETLQKETERWRVASGGKSPEVKPKLKRKKGRGRKSGEDARSQRDWGKPAEKQERGAPDMSRGDPLIRLLKFLAAYWRKVFTVTKPCLRKQGYKPLSTLEEQVTEWRKDSNNEEVYGACIENLADFQRIAQSCGGDRDVGVQLFVALLRGIGLEARLVASLQPIGYGFNKDEDAIIKPKKSSNDESIVDVHSQVDTSEAESRKVTKHVLDTKSQARPKRPKKGKGSSRGSKNTPIHLLDDTDASRDCEKLEPSDDSEPVAIETPRKRPNVKHDRDMPTPTYWVEVISSVTNKVYPVDPLILSPTVIVNDDQLSQFEPRGAKAQKAKEVMAYVVAFSADGTAKDVTTRYLKRHMWPGRTKGVRMPVEKVPIYNSKGKIKRYEEYDWFKTVMSCYERPHAKRTAADDVEEANELMPVKPAKKEITAGEGTLQGYKTSAQFVLERHLRREEALRTVAKPVRTFTSGKGDKLQEEPVYLRKDVEICRTAESWHKEGRAVKEGQEAMKMVPVRAVTTNRKREVEEAERLGGERLMQGMYAKDQTTWIIPPPIENGVIPKNAFNNIDCFVPSMVPEGAVHIPLRQTVRICKKMEIDYAEAVTGFEFGHRMAVPVITGVVIAKENEQAVLEQWEKDEEERRIKEVAKLEKQAMATWRKWLMGLRVVQRVKEEYGGGARDSTRDEVNPFTNLNKADKVMKSSLASYDQAQQQRMATKIDPTVDENQDENDGDFGGGGFLLSEHDEDKPIDSKLTVEDASGSPMKTARTPQHNIATECKEGGSGAVEASLPQEIPSSSKKGFQNDVAHSGKRRKGRTTGDTTSNNRSAEPASISRRSARRSTAAVMKYCSEDDVEEDEDSKEHLLDKSDDEEPHPKRKRGRPSGSSSKTKARGSKG